MMLRLPCGDEIDLAQSHGLKYGVIMRKIEGGHVVIRPAES
jgi:hypothetical protein